MGRGTIIAWTYEAAMHCCECAESRFPGINDGAYYEDNEGNEVRPAFSYDEIEEGAGCDDYREKLE